MYINIELRQWHRNSLSADVPAVLHRTDKHTNAKLILPLIRSSLVARVLILLIHFKIAPQHLPKARGGSSEDEGSASPIVASDHLRFSHQRARARFLTSQCVAKLVQRPRPTVKSGPSRIFGRRASSGQIWPLFVPPSASVVAGASLPVPLSFSQLLKDLRGGSFYEKSEKNCFCNYGCGNESHISLLCSKRFANAFIA